MKVEPSAVNPVGAQQARVAIVIAPARVGPVGATAKRLPCALPAQG